MRQCKIQQSGFDAHLCDSTYPDAFKLESQSHYRFHAQPPDILLSIHTKKKYFKQKLQLLMVSKFCDVISYNKLTLRTSYGSVLLYVKLGLD